MRCLRFTLRRKSQSKPARPPPLTLRRFFYIRGKECCEQVRELLGCPAGKSHCREFVGTCGQLVEQFAEVPIDDSESMLLGQWACRAFPDPQTPLHRFLTGLVMVRARGLTSRPPCVE